MRSKKLYLSVIVMIVAVFFASALRAQEQAQEQPVSPRQPRKMVGGPCTYKSYRGMCKIVSVEQTDGSKRQALMNGGPGYEGYEIKFIFTPGQPTDFSDVAWAKGAGGALLTTQYPLLLKLSSLLFYHLFFCAQEKRKKK